MQLMGNTIRLLVLAGALGLTPLGDAAAQDEIAAGQVADDVATRTDANQRMTVPVRIGEAGPFRFLVDTGAQNTVVSDVLAQRLGLAPAGRAIIIGVAGRIVVDTVTIDALTLGRRSFNHLLAPILPGVDIEADGIVGLDALQNQRILIDFPLSRITIGDAADEGGDRGFDIVVRARRRSGQLILTTAQVDGIAVDVVLDTGADATIGNLALQQAFARRRRPRETSTIQSVTGQHLPVEIMVAQAMVLGSLELHEVPIAYGDAPPFAHLRLRKRPAILLGMRELRAFKRVAIDFRQRKVLFDLAPQPGGR